ncbi:hypothetical protein GCM10008995_29170 [Halobellus salinus]|uniref:Uncharacterized protein n=1 Tax=Halobellus salinus TaxID=931585 RepID=A0A830EE90_9EURY|nr:hypothetical protein GCM10008995_29170 [Halobellus salinus]
MIDSLLNPKRTYQEFREEWGKASSKEKWRFSEQIISDLGAILLPIIAILTIPPVLLGGPIEPLLVAIVLGFVWCGVVLSGPISRFAEWHYEGDSESSKNSETPEG